MFYKTFLQESFDLFLC